MSMTRIKSLQKTEYDRFRIFLEKACGIVLGENKQYLVQNRLTHIIREYHLSDVRELIEKICSPSGEVMRQQVIEAMTTNETFWFRDNHPFIFFKNNVLKNSKSKNLKVWCAACSSGQEPYSLSICVDESMKSGMFDKTGRVEFIATDLSPAILSIAKDGSYDEFALGRGLSKERKMNYFENEGRFWRVKPDIKKRVRYKEFNLQDSYTGMGRFDVVFCRNVLIYFSQSMKEQILRKMHGILNKGGHLFLGSSESLSGLNDLFEMYHYKPGIVYIAK